jgi:hypothetical protein
MNVQVREGKKLTECFKVRETKVFLDKLRDVIADDTLISSKSYFFEDEITKFARQGTIASSVLIEIENKYKQVQVKQMYARLEADVKEAK